MSERILSEAIDMSASRAGSDFGVLSVCMAFWTACLKLRAARLVQMRDLAQGGR
jgi:hypothetical protein